ncbi:MAG TPA: hypothetical protein VJ846_08245 [Sphingomicrobium sp.]|nr:hypothetical protein [Sphingomicrobium sp.]
MRYFLDTEYNGWGGELLSLALVPDDRGEEFYITLDWQGSVQPWVQENVVPYLDMVPDAMLSPRLTSQDAARELSHWLMHEHEAQLLAHLHSSPEIEILADWPEDISHICSLLMVGPGVSVDVPPITFRLLRIPGFSTAANSKVPHNALHDARALRDHVLAME